MAVISGTGSVELPQGHVLEGLTIYGACAQDGTPSPDNPVEIKRITSLALSTSDGQRVEIDLQGYDVCSHTRTERYRDVLTIGADGHVTLEKRTQRETVTNVDKVSGATTVYAGLTATPKPKRWATYAEAAAEGYGGSLWCDMLPHAGNNPYTQATWNRLYAYAPQSAGWGQDEFNALVGAEVIDYMPSKDWYTVDLGYVELPDVRDLSTLSVIADAEPEIEVSTSEYSIAGGGASMNGRNLLRFTGQPTYAGDNTAAHREIGWCSIHDGTLERTEDGMRLYSESLDAGYIIPTVPSLQFTGGESEVLTLSFQYRTSFRNMTFPIYLLSAQGSVWRRSDSALVYSETEWQTFENTFYFPDVGERVPYAVYLPSRHGSWLEIKDGTMKLEYGTTATPWRAAPEDTEQPSDLVYASEGVDLGDTSGLDTRLTTAESSITQQAGQIALKANASDVNTKAETAALLEVKANKATLTSEINASADTVKIDATRVNIEGAAIFTSGRLSQTSLDGAYDASGAASGAVNALKTDLADPDGTTVINGGHITTGTIDASKATITNINGANITAGTLTIGQVSNLSNTLNGKASTTDVANAAKRTYVSIRATAIDYAADTATLEATLYIDGSPAAAANNVTYEWLLDGVTISGATSQAYAVPATSGLSHAYSCKCTATI